MHALVIHLYAIGHQLLDAQPVGRFKHRFGAGAGRMEQGIMFVKPFQNNGCNRFGL